MLLIAVAVVAVAGFAVYRLHGIFGSHHNTSNASAITNDLVSACSVTVRAARL